MRHLHHLLVPLALASTAGLAFADGPDHCPKADAAIKLLVAKTTAARLYLWAKEGCLVYDTERCGRDGRVEIAIHENHKPSCGGDPATAPRVDGYRIDTRTGTIEWFDIVDGEYAPFEKAIEARRRK